VWSDILHVTLLVSYTALFALCLISMKRCSEASPSPTPKRAKKEWQTKGYVCEWVANSNVIEGEIWKKVPESLAPGNNSYVSDHGRVKSCTGVMGYPTPKKSGYVQVGIGGKRLSLHQVILAAFEVDPPSPAHKYVNHIDLNPSNNRLANLEWTTHALNMQHSFANNPHRKSCAGKQSKPIRGRKDGEEEWVEYESLSHAARVLGISSGSICTSIYKGYKAGSAYRFEFSEPTEPALLEGEEWKAWGAAEISNLGRYKDCRGVVKTPAPHPDGYTLVVIGRKNHLIHRLVAELFLPPPGPGQTQVDHIHGVEQGNAWWNLRWATRSQNIEYTYANPNRKSNAPKRSKKVRVRKIDGTEWRVFSSVCEAARVLGLAPAGIARCCHENA
jgi:hypothetical protein